MVQFVLFVDEYERVFDQGGAGRQWVDNPFDRHMRGVVAETNGLLVVFFSRERLPWAEDPDWRADLADAQHLLGGLAEKDADTFLAAVPIDDAAIRAAIIDGAREKPDRSAPVYPLLLDLLVEHWQALAGRGDVRADEFRLSADTFAGRCRQIVERVLRDYDDGLQATIERLSLTRRFDKAAFAFVVREFGTAVPLDVFDRLARLSFVEQADDGFLVLHNAVAETLRETLDDARREEALTRLFQHFWARAKVETHFDLDDAKIAALFEAAHLRARMDARTYGEWLAGASYLLARDARFKSCHALWDEALSITESANGPEHPATGTVLNNLALLLQAMGDISSAKPLFERALAISEKAHGGRHPTTTARLNNLASLLQAMGDYAEAKPLFERALAISENVNGPEDPSTGVYLNNLALLLRDMGRYVEAGPHFERALTISAKANGEKHPATALIIHNLGLVLHDLGRYAEAKLHFERALEISEESNGPEHRSTGAILISLGHLLQTMRENVRAKVFFERALTISEKANGPEHPATGMCLNNVAGVVFVMGDHAGARLLLERALAISEKANGLDHPATGECLNRLAGVLYAVGDCSGAKSRLERQLAIIVNAYGTEHPATRACMAKLADVLEDMGDHDGAKRLLERAAAIEAKTKSNSP